MVRKIGAIVLLASAAAIGFMRLHARATTSWETAAPGVEVRTVEAADAGLSGSRQVIALRVLPGRVHIDTGSMLDAAGWRSRSAGLAAVNGGFFDPVGRSVGLRIDNGHTTTRARKGNGGVFYVRDGAAHIASTADFLLRRRSLAGIQDAVQCSPLLVSGGHSNRLKPQSNRRTGIGIQADGHVVIAVSDGPLTLPEWAACWASTAGLHCTDALNLDGGPSTQLSLKTPHRSMEITGGWPVPDAVVIK